MALYVWPPQAISVNSGPLEVLVNGVATQVDYNTGTPANSTPVPVYITGGGSGSGALDYGASSAAARTAAQIGNATGAAAFGAGNSSAQTLRVVVATDQPAVAVSAATLPLPTGAATEATLSALSAKLGTLGQKAMAGSAPVVIASDQSPIDVLGSSDFLEVTGSAAALDADAIAATNVSTYRSVFVQVSGTYNGAIALQGTNDGVTWFNVLGQVVNSASTAPTAALASATGLLWVPILFKTFRVRMTAYTSGTATAVALFSGLSASDLGLRVVSAVQSGAWNITNITGTVSLPTGASTETTLSALNAKFGTLGQKAMAGSAPVVIASDQASIPVASTPATVAGTVTNASITVGTSPVRATVSGLAPSASRKLLMVQPAAANTGTIYIGSSSVSTANGMQIVGPDRLTFEFDSGDYYLISDTAGQSVQIVEKA